MSTGNESPSRRVVCLQLAPPPPDQLLEERIEVVAAELRACAGADLLILPEMWPTGYFGFDRYEDAASEVPGRLSAQLGALAAELGTHLVAGTAVERGADGRLRNCAMLLGPDGALLGSYRKIHTFGYGSREAELIEAGVEPLVVETDLGRIGLSICYDLRFPELYRELIDRGAEILVLVASWPQARAEHWLTLTRARAIESQAWMVACGAGGVDRGIELAGSSCVVAPSGEVLALAGQGEERIEAELDLSRVHAQRHEFPALADRRLGRERGGSSASELQQQGG